MYIFNQTLSFANQVIGGKSLLSPCHSSFPTQLFVSYTVSEKLLSILDFASYLGETIMFPLYHHHHLLQRRGRLDPQISLQHLYFYHPSFAFLICYSLIFLIGLLVEANLLPSDKLYISFSLTTNIDLDEAPKPR
jgi:hypothetical protein